jgi:hypothetical protein
MSELRESRKYHRYIHKVTLCLKGILKVLGCVCGYPQSKDISAHMAHMEEGGVYSQGCTNIRFGQNSKILSS